MSDIRTDAYLPHPVERVWDALTDPIQLAEWLMPNDFQARVGHRFTFRTDLVPSEGFDGVIHCTVLILRPPELLSISWTGGPGLDTVVTWQCAPEVHGTRLFLTHDGFDDNDPAQQAVKRILGRGWRGHMARRLERHLADEANRRARS